MPANTATTYTYASALAVRAQMRAFHAELAAHPGWKLASNILLRRFELAFAFFLDAPTPDRLARVVGFTAEMHHIARRLPDLGKRSG